MKGVKFTKEQLEGLYKKGHISEESYAKLCSGGYVQKMSAGGMASGFGGMPAGATFSSPTSAMGAMQAAGMLGQAQPQPSASSSAGITGKTGATVGNQQQMSGPALPPKGQQQQQPMQSFQPQQFGGMMGGFQQPGFGGFQTPMGFQMFSEGGKVKKMADGGMSLPSDAQVAQETAPPTGLDYLQGNGNPQSLPDDPAPAPAAPGILDTLKDKWDTLQKNMADSKTAKAAGQQVQYKDGHIIPASTAEGPQVGGEAPALASDVTAKPSQQSQLGDLSRQLMAQGYQGLDKSFGMQEDAIKQGAAAGQKAAAAEGAFLGEQANQMDQMRAVQNIKNQKQQDAEQEALNKYNDVRDQMLSQKIDPDRVFKRMGTAQKIMTLIGLGISGRAGPEMLKNLIEKDVDAQKADMMNVRAGVDAAHNAYQMLRQKGMDDFQATMGAKAMQLDAVSMRIKAMAAKYQSPQIQANSQALLAGIEKEKAGMQIQLAQSIQSSPAMIYHSDRLQKIASIPDPKMKAQALSELPIMDKRDRSIKEMDLTLDKLAALQKNGNKLLSPLQTRSLTDTYNLQIATLAKEIFGRVNPQEIDMLLKGASIDYTDDANTIAEKKANLRNFIKTHSVTPILDDMGLGSKDLDLKPL
jgi:hypothetical protein